MPEQTTTIEFQSGLTIHRLKQLATWLWMFAVVGLFSFFFGWSAIWADIVIVYILFMVQRMEGTRKIAMARVANGEVELFNVRFHSLVRCKPEELFLIEAKDWGPFRTVVVFVSGIGGCAITDKPEEIAPFESLIRGHMAKEELQSEQTRYETLWDVWKLGLILGPMILLYAAGWISAFWAAELDGVYLVSAVVVTCGVTVILLHVRSIWNEFRRLAPKVLL